MNTAVRSLWIPALAACFAISGAISCGDNNESLPVQQPGTAAPTPTPNPSPSATMTLVPVQGFQVGFYGGENILFTQNADQTESLNFPCAGGQIPSPIAVDSAGNFSANGDYYLMSGPIPVNGYPFLPANFHGTLHGDKLTLTVDYMDGAGNSQTVGPLHATFGDSAAFSGVCATSASPPPGP